MLYGNNISYKKFTNCLKDHYSNIISLLTTTKVCFSDIIETNIQSKIHMCTNLHYSPLKTEEQQTYLRDYFMN